MENLITFLVILAVIVINALKLKNEQSAKRRQAPKQPGEQPPKQQPTTLEEFFDEIARKFEPQPRELPDWPESVERPDYVQELEEYETAKAAPKPKIQTEKTDLDRPRAKPLDSIPILEMMEASNPIAREKSTVFKMPSQGAAFAGLGNMRIPTPKLLRSATGQTKFELKNKEQLKQALIASMVFGPARAYDASFDTTIAK